MPPSLYGGEVTFWWAAPAWPTTATPACLPTPGGGVLEEDLLNHPQPTHPLVFHTDLFHFVKLTPTYVPCPGHAHLSIPTLFNSYHVHRTLPTLSNSDGHVHPSWLTHRILIKPSPAYHPVQNHTSRPHLFSRSCFQGVSPPLYRVRGHGSETQ